MHITVALGDHLGAIERRIWRHLSQLTDIGALGRPARRKDFRRTLVVLGPRSAFTEELHQEGPESTRFSLLSGAAFDDSGDAIGLSSLRTLTAPGVRVPDGEYNYVDVFRKGETATAHVMMDRWGSRPIFYAKTDHAFVISTDALAAGVAIGASDLDEKAVDDFLTFGHAITDQTTIAGVRRLTPGSCLRVAADARGIGTHMWTTPTSALTGGSESLEGAFSDLIDGADRRMKWLRARTDRVICQLSAGLDSRLTTAAIKAADPGPVTALTLELEGPDEVRIASEVAAALKVPHRTVSIDRATITDGLTGFLLTGGQVPLHAAAGNICGYRALPHGIRGVIGAWPGDVLAGSYVPEDRDFLRPSRTESAIERWAQLRGFPDQTVRALLGEPAVDRSARRREALLDSLRVRPEADAASRVTMWAMTVRQPAFSFISPARSISDIIELTPCLDSAYVSRFLALSPEALIGRNAYRQFILEAIPETAAIDRGGYGEPVSSQWVRPGARQHLRWLAKTSPPVAGIRQRLRRPPAISAEVGRWRQLLASSNLVKDGIAELPSGHIDLNRVVDRTTDLPGLNLASALVTLVLTLRTLGSGHNLYS